MYGLDKRDWLFVRKVLIEPLQSMNCKVFVFGSRARGDFKKYSDLDILVETDQDISQVLGRIEEKLEESSLPIKVDIVLEKNLAKSYQTSVLKDRILLV